MIRFFVSDRWGCAPQAAQEHSQQDNPINPVDRENFTHAHLQLVAVVSIRGSSYHSDSSKTTTF
jgi:hypothetical protein